MTTAARGTQGAFWHWLKCSPVRYVLLLALDGVLASGSLTLALLLRFDGYILAPYPELLPRFLALLVSARVVANLLLKLHRWSFRFSGLSDGLRVVLAGLLGTGLFMSAVYFSQMQGPPRSVVVLEFFFSTAAMAVVRFSPRLAWRYLSDRTRTSRSEAIRTVIVGAGVAGDLLLRDLHHSDEHNYQIVGFVDDDPTKWGMIVNGQPVLGGIADLPQLAKKHGIAKVLIAIPRLPAKRIREILSLCADLKLRFKILPVSYVYLHDRAATAMLTDLTPEDLLTREAVSFSDSGAACLVRGRRVMVTGAGGSIGSEVCLQLARGGVGQLVMVDLNENGLYMLKRRLEREHPDVPAVAEVADIRDPGRMRALVERYRPQDVFHAAAHKHVPLMEAAPCEAVKNNVLGTRNVALAASTCGVERFVYISTDKAVRPTSAMGATKRVGEMLVRAMAQRSKTRFCVVRFGNVLGSAGSVVPIFREQIAAGGPVTVTHPDVRRYFMTLSEAVGLVLQATYGDYGELCVLDMGEQIRIVDLARHMITMVSLVPEVDIPIVFTGLRPGEKLFEELLTDEEERAQPVDRKIFVAQSPPPPEDLAERISQLERVAAAQEHQRVVALLRELVPSYRPFVPPASLAQGETLEQEVSIR